MTPVQSGERDGSSLRLSNRDAPGRHGPDKESIAAPQVPGPVTGIRRKVVVAAIALMDRHTYRSMTIGAIVRLSGVSKPGGEGPDGLRAQ